MNEKQTAIFNAAVSFLQSTISKGSLTPDEYNKLVKSHGNMSRVELAITLATKVYEETERATRSVNSPALSNVPCAHRPDRYG